MKAECINGLIFGQDTIEVINMTEKELLYVEDALGHEKFFQSKCQEAMSQMQDPELRACVAEMEKKHQQLFQSFYNLL